MRSLKNAIHSPLIHSSAFSIALASFVGVMVGVSPFFGLHLVICVILAVVFRLNLFVMYAWANISIPVLAPFWAVLSLRVGKAIFGESSIGSLELPNQTEVYSYLVSEKILTRVFLEWFIGALMVGVVLGSVVFFCVYGLARYGGHYASRLIRPTNKKPLSALSLSAIFLEKRSRFEAGYVFFKYLIDPVYRMIVSKRFFSGTVVDLGGGQGLLGHALLQNDIDKTIVSYLLVDWDQRKLTSAQQITLSLSETRMHFFNGDLKEFLGQAGSLNQPISFLLIDVLHYFAPQDQETIIGTILAKINFTMPANIIIRDMSQSAGIKLRLTMILERCALWIGLSRARAVFPVDWNKILAELESRGFVIEQCYCGALGLFHNWLLIARFTPSHQESKL